MSTLRHLRQPTVTNTAKDHRRFTAGRHLLVEISVGAVPRLPSIDMHTATYISTGHRFSVVARCLIWIFRRSLATCNRNRDTHANPHFNRRYYFSAALYLLEVSKGRTMLRLILIGILTPARNSTGHSRLPPRDTYLLIFQKGTCHASSRQEHPHRPTPQKATSFCHLPPPAGCL